MKPSILSTIFFGMVSAAQLAVLLLWRDAFEFWQKVALLAGAVILAMLALGKGEW